MSTDGTLSIEVTWAGTGESSLKHSTQFYTALKKHRIELLGTSGCLLSAHKLKDSFQICAADKALFLKLLESMPSGAVWGHTGYPPNPYEQQYLADTELIQNLAIAPLKELQTALDRCEHYRRQVADLIFREMLISPDLDIHAVADSMDWTDRVRVGEWLLSQGADPSAHLAVCCIQPLAELLQLQARTQQRD